MTRIAVLHDFECVDPVEKAIAKHFGIPHDSAVCACRCHETVYSYESKIGTVRTDI